MDQMMTRLGAICVECDLGLVVARIDLDLDSISIVELTVMDRWGSTLKLIDLEIKTGFSIWCTCERPEPA